MPAVIENCGCCVICEKHEGKTRCSVKNWFPETNHIFSVKLFLAICTRLKQTQGRTGLSVNGIQRQDRRGGDTVRMIRMNVLLGQCPI